MKMLPPAIAFAMALTAGANAQALTEVDRQAIINGVVQHFREHPQELVEAILDWREKETAKLAKPAPVPVTGNPSGDVVVYEFQDYGCQACREAGSVLDRLAAEDGAISIVHYDHPVSGQEAVSAALDLVAANAAGGDYAAARKVLLENGDGPETRTKALQAAGVGPTVLDRAAAAETLRNNRDLAAKTGIGQLPAVVVVSGTRMIPLSGKINYEDLQAAVSSVRSDP